MTWPTEAQCPKFYGPKGQNQTSIALPFPMVLDWDKTKTIRTITCHEKVADSLTRIFRKILSEYGEERIKTLGINQFGGCLNVRLKRGSKTSWSIHSWGCAVDIDPDRNQLRWGRDRAELAKPVYETMWRIWESEGWISLGRARGYDFMHAQAARI